MWQIKFIENSPAGVRCVSCFYEIYDAAANFAFVLEYWIVNHSLQSNNLSCSRRPRNWFVIPNSVSVLRLSTVLLCSDIQSRFTWLVVKLMLWRRASWTALLLVLYEIRESKIISCIAKVNSTLCDSATELHVRYIFIVPVEFITYNV